MQWRCESSDSVNFFFETARQSIASVGVSFFMQQIASYIMIDTVLLATQYPSFKLTWSIYRFGTSIHVALVKEAKFADQ